MFQKNLFVSPRIRPEISLKFFLKLGLNPIRKYSPDLQLCAKKLSLRNANKNIS